MRRQHIKKRQAVKQSPHFLRYDAQRYETDGFIEVAGRVRQLAQKPRHWSVSVTCMTQDPATGDKLRTHFNFRPIGRYMLSELAPVINEEIHSHDDYLPDCISVMVVARVLDDHCSKAQRAQRLRLRDQEIIPP